MLKTTRKTQTLDADLVHDDDVVAMSSALRELRRAWKNIGKAAEETVGEVEDGGGDGGAVQQFDEQMAKLLQDEGKKNVVLDLRLPNSESTSLLYGYLFSITHF